MNTEQPYFVVKVTRCGECPHFDEFEGCWLVSAVWPHSTLAAKQVAIQNFSGITPTCPMWPQRVQEKKDE